MNPQARDRIPNRFPLLIVLLGLASVALGATVDVPAGTSSAPREITAADISRAGPGGVIRLGTGYYRANRVRPLAGQSFVGTTQIAPGRTAADGTYTDPSAVTESIILIGGREAFYIENANKVRFANLTITGNGGALWVEGGDVQDLVIDQCRMHSDAPTAGNNNLLYMTYTRRLVIEDSILSGGGGVNQLLFSYGMIDGHIAYNRWIGGGDHIHLDAKNDSRGVVIEQNHHTGNKRMPLEYQGKGYQLQHLDNWSERPDWGAPENLLNWSLPSDQSWGTTSRGNVTIVPDGPGANDFVRMLFEFAGTAFVCEGNLTIGGNHVVAVTNRNATGKIVGNHFEAFRKGPDNNGGKVEVRDNVQPALKARLLARGRPGPMVRFGATPPPDPIPPEPPTTQRIIIEGQNLTVTGP